MARTRFHTRKSAGGKAPRPMGKAIRKRRAAPTFRSHKHRIKICKYVTTQSREAKKYLRALHSRQGRRGTVKIPGYRHRYIVDSALRKEARHSSRDRKRILRRLARRYKRGKIHHFS